MQNKLTLTYSMMACALRCPRKLYYEYVLGLKLINTDEALRMGTAIHNAGEARANGASFVGQYEAAISGTNLDEIMAAKAYGIVGAYDSIYGEIEDLDYERMLPEVEFESSIEGNRTFIQRGKIDGIAHLRNGERVVWERKTTSDDISETSDYWQRLKFNHQLLVYADYIYTTKKKLPSCVYDVIRKPALQLKANVPEFDENGLPIVLDANGNRCIKKDGTPKKTADSAKGERMAGHPETPDEYGERILATIKADPTKYFCRKLVTITWEMLQEFRLERLAVCRMIQHYTKESKKSPLPEQAYPRSCNPLNCKHCAYSGFCLNRIHVSEDSFPDGFIIAHHQELSSH